MEAPVVGRRREASMTTIGVTIDETLSVSAHVNRSWELVPRSCTLFKQFGREVYI